MFNPNVKHLVLAITLGMNLGCGGAQAMGKKPQAPAPAPVEVNLPPPPPATTDRYRQGLDLGTSNGERMVLQIKRSTIGVQGCDGQPAFEYALLAVVKVIRPPTPGTGEDLDLARGYYKGYSRAFGQALRTARADCSLPTVVTGQLPGTVVGNLLCGAGSIDVQLLNSVEVEPIYAGWSGGRSESKSDCENVAIKIADGCTIGKLEDRTAVEKILNDQIALGCAD